MRIHVTKPVSGKTEIRVDGDVRQGLRQVGKLDVDVGRLETELTGLLEQVFYEESLSRHEGRF